MSRRLSARTATSICRSLQALALGIASGSGSGAQASAGSDVITESEIVCEYIDAVSAAAGPRLVPGDPLAASHVRRPVPWSPPTPAPCVCGEQGGWVEGGHRSRVLGRTHAFVAWVCDQAQSWIA